MAEVKEIIREMLQRGMEREEVLATLRDIGIENPEDVMREAMESMKATGQPTGEAKPPALESKEGSGGQEPEQGGLVEEHEIPPATTLTATGESVEALDAKMEEALALLKALQDINKKILETNRDILLRLKQ